jgi:hypothetical protein
MRKLVDEVFLISLFRPAFDHLGADKQIRHTA